MHVKIHFYALKVRFSLFVMRLCTYMAISIDVKFWGVSHLEDILFAFNHHVGPIGRSDHRSSPLICSGLGDHGGQSYFEIVIHGGPLSTCRSFAGMKLPTRTRFCVCIGDCFVLYVYLIKGSSLVTAHGLNVEVFLFYN
eukprot:TRINITY_DN27581_c0_g1_i1.p1 TRINITY_DN27581_c0_g1~~TRINITY_DN27581_c0_g1_i1.p1  ORF type:complete len:139 (+),score=8.75 TRINITY_DN27581_c0_g1_i1:182-598(+)